jgi:hypothetical protein
MRGYFPNGKHVWPCGLAPSLLVKTPPTNNFVFSAAISAWLTASHPNREVSRFEPGTRGSNAVGGKHAGRPGAALFLHLFFFSFLVSFFEALRFPLFVVLSFLLRTTLAQPQALHVCIDEAKSVFTGRARGHFRSDGTPRGQHP